MDIASIREPVCREDLADFVSLAEPERKEASERVGRIGITIVESVFDAARILTPLRMELAQAVRGADGKRAVTRAVADVIEAHAEDDALGDALFVPMLMAEMAGQLMVRQTVPALSLDGPRFRMAADGSAQPVGSFLNLPWEEAIREFKARGIVREDELSKLIATYADRSEEGRALLLGRIQTRVREMLATALEEGQTFGQFADALEGEATGLGITTEDHAYLESVFRTNVQSAYGAGRFRQLTDPVIVSARPYVQYRTAGDARVRPAHEKLDGPTHKTAYRIDGSTWHAIAPPNGFSCRCACVSLSAAEADGLTILDAVPAGGEPDEGFDGPPVANVEKSLL